MKITNLNNVMSCRVFKLLHDIILQTSAIGCVVKCRYVRMFAHQYQGTVIKYHAIYSNSSHSMVSSILHYF